MQRLSISASNFQFYCDWQSGLNIQLSRDSALLLTTVVMTLSSFFIFFCNKLKTLVANGKWVSFKDEQQETSTAMTTWKVTFCFKLKDSFSPTPIKSSTLKNKQTPLMVALNCIKTTFSTSAYLGIISSIFRDDKYKTLNKQ